MVLSNVVNGLRDIMQNNALEFPVFRSVRHFFTKGHERSVKAKLNILASLVIRGGSILIGFAMVPLTLSYLDPTKYGIWLTLFSVISWFSLFDIGLGNGFRNKFAEALAENKRKLARVYLCTTYVILVLLSGLIFCTFLVVDRFVDWSRILNCSPELSGELRIVIFSVVAFFCISFVLQLITTVLIADQRPAKANLLKMLGNLLSLAIVIILNQMTQNGSLVYLGIGLSASPALLLLVGTIFYFSRDYREFIPSIRYVKFSYAKDLTSVGLQFFIIQMGALVLYATDNIIISQLFNPEAVTKYNIVFKYFQNVLIIFALISQPLWSAYTEAYVKRDLDWIRRVIKKSLRIWVLLATLVLFMLVVSDDFYRLWVGDELRIPFSLSLTMALYTLLVTFVTIFVSFINGIGKLRIQLFASLFTILVNIPLSIFLAKNMHLGPAGVLLGTCIIFLLSFILYPLQYYKIIQGKARGIWNK